MGFGPGMGWGWLFWLLLVVGVVLLVVIRSIGGGVTRRGDGNGRSGKASSPAHQILDERYARGEITTEVYRDRVRTLGEI